MKASSVSLIVAAIFSATAGAANWSSEAREDGQTQFQLKLQGEVPQRCRMVTQQDLELVMDLKEGTESKFKFKAWCNVDSSKGKLVVGAAPFINKNNKDIIPLVVKFAGDQGLIDGTTHASNGHAIQTDFTVSNATEKDMGNMQVLKIKPKINRWEKSGEYQTDMYVALYPQ